ncbi:MAG: hypothetical protein ABI298_06820, partial [Acidimicrobiales bacterium]
PTGALVGSYAISALMLLLALSGAGSIITYIIIVVANRADPDPTGKRTSTIYHVGTAFLTLWLEIAGVITIFVTLFALIGASGNRYFSSAVHPLRDATVRGITIGLLLSVVGGMVTLTHRGKAIALAESDPDESSPAKRVVRSYAAAVSFISVIVVVVTGLIALWSVLGLIAPGVYEAGSRTSDVRMLLDEATVLAVFAWVFSSHRQIMAGRSGH